METYRRENREMQVEFVTKDKTYKPKVRPQRRAKTQHASERSGATALPLRDAPLRLLSRMLTWHVARFHVADHQLGRV